ncbi:MAG: hypothetical protein JW836_10195 [Deltaproteobacteria bacterium]|nr:hypothetical protein [Deltaproteobacteria bacterium]
MKTYVLIAFVVLAGAVAVYFVTSLQNVATERIRKEELPQGVYEIIKWVSDAGGIAYIMDNPSEQTPVIVNRGMGKKESEGLRPSHDYRNAVPGKTQVYRIINKNSKQPFAYVLASERLEIETGFNILKGSAILSIRDPEDSHHKKMREGP